ncbi:MAG: hypothetical protein PHR87_11560 [Sulfurospirillaceae bacterium]|nr:hypothetical protein [Sulfurospirillaceae bacterium]
MTSWYHAVDVSIEIYIKQAIDNELHKDIEDIIFFSSYTIGLDVFKEATQKLKARLSQDEDEIDIAAQEEARKFLRQYHLRQALSQKKQRYIARELIKAHIRINEAVLEHFYSLQKKAHSFEYFQERKENIYKLLEDE